MRPVSQQQVAKRNAEVVLQYSTVYPFRQRGKSMYCVYCCEEYDDPQLYREHMDNDHKKFTVSTAFAHIGRSKEYLKVDCTNLKCRICDEPQESIEEVAKHLKYEHMKKIDVNFDIAMQPYRMDQDKWICVLCNSKYPSLIKLCRHTTSHYKKFTCDVCGRCYLTIEALKYHIRCSHSGSHQCRKCWSEFPTLEKKREHVKNSKTCWPFCCLSCGERFMSWENKQKHQVKLHGLPKRVYTCPECGETFSSRQHFYPHFTLNHTDESYICPCCGLRFGSRKQMEDHRLGHSGEKQFQCQVCYKLFTRNKSLKQHMWIHSDSKRFACVICDKQFAQKVSLTGHLRSQHPEVPINVQKYC